MVSAQWWNTSRFNVLHLQLKDLLGSRKELFRRPQKTIESEWVRLGYMDHGVCMCVCVRAMSSVCMEFYID